MQNIFYYDQNSCFVTYLLTDTAGGKKEQWCCPAGFPNSSHRPPSVTALYALPLCSARSVTDAHGGKDRHDTQQTGQEGNKQTCLYTLSKDQLFWKLLHKKKKKQQKTAFQIILDLYQGVLIGKSWGRKTSVILEETAILNLVQFLAVSHSKRF